MTMPYSFWLFYKFYRENHIFSKASSLFLAITLNNQKLFEVELIINITIETCLTPNHLLFGRHLLYSSDTTSALATNLSVLSSTADKINRISNHFWDRWRHKYIVNLHETQRTSKLNIKRSKGTQALLENCHQQMYQLVEIVK